MARVFPWLDRPFIQALIKALGPDDMRFVGGAVRDSLIGRDVKDIDIATRHLPETAMEKLTSAGLKVIPTGLKHGTVTAVCPDSGESAEITTLRMDMETDGRHAEVAFTDDWLEDAKRRDFTMNAIYLDANGDLYDPFDGVLDAVDGRVRFIGDAAERIKEDALRMLRFFRFFAHFGSGHMDADALRAIAAYQEMVKGLSTERIRDEIMKLLTADDPAPALEQMKATGLLDHVVPVNPMGIGAIGAMEASEHARETLALRRLFLLVDPVAREAFFEGFRLSNAEQQHLKDLESYRIVGVQLSLAERLYRFGLPVVLSGLLITGDNDLLEQALATEIPIFPLQGQDLLDAGMTAGPKVGKSLKALENMWITSGFEMTKDELLASL